MESNTLQTLIDSIKDLTGQDGLSNAKAIRALNFAVDDYTRQRILANGRFTADSANYGNISRVTTTLTSSDTKVQLPLELISIRQVEVMDNNGYYQIVQPTDIQDEPNTPLETQFTTAGMPQRYDIESNHLYPFPTTDQNRTLRITYQRAHPRFSTANLTQDTGVLMIDEEYVVLYASRYIMYGSNDPIVSNIKADLMEKKREISKTFGNLDQDRTRRVRNVVNSTFSSNQFKIR